MKKHVLLILVAVCALTTSNAQRRYYNEVFTNSQIVVHRDSVYGVNLDFLQNPTNPTPVNLKMDIYEPNQSVDQVAQRPLFIYIHTGNFLPVAINGSVSGTKTDSACVEVCRQMARRGYVAVSMDYRTGWNPVSSDLNVRRGTLLVAVYRALNDSRSCVRYFKKSYVNGNPFKIDSSRIVMYGQGSGGYVTSAYATLNKYSELATAGKFGDGVTSLYIDTALYGQVNGIGGRANMPNNWTYSDNVSICINVGGALADTSWLEPGSKPIMAFHCVRDPFAPYREGTVIVPTTNDPVVDVSGSGTFIDRANGYGNNTSFTNAFYNDPYTTAARALYNKTIAYIYPAPLDVINISGSEGLYPFVRPINPLNRLLNEGDPWTWWDSLQYTATINFVFGGTVNPQPILANARLGNADMSKAKALAYIDTIVNYMSPRLVNALLLPGNNVGVNEVTTSDVQVYPNPNNGTFRIALKNPTDRIQAIEITDILGKVVFVTNNINVNLFEGENLGLSRGVYTVKINSRNSSSIEKLVIQ